MATFGSVFVAFVAIAMSSIAALETNPSKHLELGGLGGVSSELRSVRGKTSRRLLQGDRTPLGLIRAASSGDSDLVKVIIASGVPVDAINPIGWTALTAACTANHLETVQVLIEAGADVDHKAAGGITPLMAASTEGNLDVIKLLLEYGAKKDLAASGKTAQDVVCTCTDHVIGLVFRHCNTEQCANVKEILAVFDQPIDGSSGSTGPVLGL